MLLDLVPWIIFGIWCVVGLLIFAQITESDLPTWMGYIIVFAGMYLTGIFYEFLFLG